MTQQGDHDEMPTNSEVPPPSLLVLETNSEAHTALRETWNEFKSALYAPANEEFNAFYWVCCLAKGLLNFLVQQKLRNVIPWFRPVM